jgi:acylglycerol lipase
LGYPNRKETVSWYPCFFNGPLNGKVPISLHSDFFTQLVQGGGEVLSFVVQQSYHSPQYAETVASLAGVIVTSPLILQTIPASKVARWLGGKAAIVTPYTLVPAPVNADDLSHSPEMNQAYSKDPLIKSTGSLRGIGDMLTEGEKLLSVGCHHWPRKLPVLFVHGDADKVTSVKATQTFYEEIDAEDKKIILYPNGFHELHNELPPVRRKLVADVVSFIQARTPVHEAKETPQPSQSSQPTLTVPAPQVQLTTTTNSEGENSSDNSGSTSRSSTPTSVEPDPTIKRSPEVPTPTTNPSSRL